MKNSANLRYILHVLFKYKAHSAIVLLATLLTITVLTSLASPIYESSSTLLIKFGRQYEYLPGVGTGKGSAGYYNREGIINTEIQILLSRDLLEKTCREIGIEKLYPNLYKKKSYSDDKIVEEAVNLFTNNLSVNGNNKSNILNIAFRHVDHEVAMNAVTTLVSLFKSKHVLTFSDPDVTIFLEKKVAFYGDLLKHSEESLRQFKQDNKTFQFDNQVKLLLEERNKISELYTLSKGKSAKFRGQFESMQEQIANIQESIPLFSETSDKLIINNSKSELLALQLKEKELLLKLEETSPEIVNLRERIKLAQDFVQEQEANQQTNIRIGKSEVYQDIQRNIILTRAEMKAQEAESAILAQQLRLINETLFNLSRGEEELNRLIREQQINEKNYKIYLSKLEESKISQEMDRQKMTNIKIVEPASMPTKPVWPNNRLNLILGMTLGVFFAMILAFLSEYINQGLHSEEGVKRRLGLPLLTTLFLRNEAVRAATEETKQPVPNEVASVIPDPVADNMLGLYHTSTSLLGDRAKKVVQFIAASSGEGTSTISHDFAYTTASLFEKAVLLIRQESGPHSGKVLHIDKILSAQQPVKEIFHQDGDTGVWHCATADIDKPLAAFFASDQINQFLLRLREAFDLIIIDSSPLSVSQDGLVIGREVDGVIIVVESERTRWPVVKNLIDKLGNVKAHKLGVILNKQRKYIPNSIYRLL